MAVALTYMYRLMFKNVSGMVFSKLATTFYYDLKLSVSVLCIETQKKAKFTKQRVMEAKDLKSSGLSTRCFAPFDYRF